MKDISIAVQTRLTPLLGVVCLLVSQGTQAQTRLAVSENDFLDDMPIVLSVSRLPQRLDETPGAVTLIDHDMIRRSGARDVADLLRLVPGFQTTESFESVAPLASYHGALDRYATRMQVLVDGRSVYSPYFIGSTGFGLQAVALQDIESIEVLRGSNSASYGARAMLGVINIVTRHTQDTLGPRLSVTRGENGVHDTQASLGWGFEWGSARIGVDQRADDGLLGANGRNQLNRVNLRADYRTDARTELQIRAGLTSLNSGKGQLGTIEERPVQLDSSFVQLDWQRNLGPDSDLALSVSHSRESYVDKLLSYQFDYDGISRNNTLTAIHTFRQGPDLRVVWGGELRRESIMSKSFYQQEAALDTDFSRLFGNLEWRLAPAWMLNAGGLIEHNSVSGESVAPRMMLNWHVAPGHTLRAGVSRAFRPPSTFEKSARIDLLGTPYIHSTGQVQPESLRAQELGYFADLPHAGLSWDVRVFREELGGFIRQLNASFPRDYANDEDFAITGGEYQIKWRPWTGAQILFNQAYIDISSVREKTGTPLAAPKLASSLVLMQKFANGLDLTLTHQDSGTATLHGSGMGSAVAMTRTDVRLAWPLRWGARHGEVALVVQNLGEPYQDYDPAYVFRRRAFVTLQLDN
ncbi:TonB-dependent siderophore receptor [Rhodoferax sp.]|uniref:TonB-dependent receptor plug domain-containing protein n=1 Tax=Rhodoferax sp. TaxID=50421 RepID=UPI0027204A5B|nr:TonB-dependent receptor [Rhodoferax sp.]MDO8318376.1 TonB-dependent receptor [Rhodoferax sp.]